MFQILPSSANNPDSYLASLFIVIKSTHFTFYLLISWSSSSNGLCWNMSPPRWPSPFPVWGGRSLAMGLVGMDLTKPWVFSTYRYWFEWPNCIGSAWQSAFQGLCWAGQSASCCQQRCQPLRCVGSSFRRNWGDIELNRQKKHSSW